jgi:hypothetical protein
MSDILTPDDGPPTEPHEVLDPDAFEHADTTPDDEDEGGAA